MSEGGQDSPPLPPFEGIVMPIPADKERKLSNTNSSKFDEFQEMCYRLYTSFSYFLFLL